MLIIMNTNRIETLGKTSFLARVTVAMLLATVPLAVRAGAFTPGNLVVEQLGDGTQTLATTGNTMFMEEFTTNGTTVQSIKIPDNGSSALIDDGTATTGGGMTLSPDGRVLCFPGFNTAQPYISSLSAASSTAVPRGVGTINASGVYQLQATTTNLYSALTIRGATTDGKGNFWASGAASSGVGGGICYLGTNSSPALLAGGTFRQTQLFGSNLWFDVQNSSGSGGYNSGIYEFTGAPTGAAVPALIFKTNSITPTISPYGFAMNNSTNPTVIYYSDDGSSSIGGIHKLTNNGSGTWSQAYLVYANPVFGLAADWTTTPVTLYATTGHGAPVNSLIRVVDNGASSPAVTNATAGANEIFRGVAFAPSAPISVTAGNNYFGGQLNLTCTTVPGGVYSWSGPGGFSSGQQNPTITNVSQNAVGIYTVIVTVGGAYAATATTTVTINTLQGLSSLYWVGVPLNNWDLLVSNVWRTVGTSTFAGYADGDLVIFDDTASNFLVNVATIVTPSSVLVSNSANNYVIGGRGGIAGFNLTKQGGGTLTLATTNTYMGNTIISAGTLVLGAAMAVPGGGSYGNVSVNGTLDVNGFSPTFNNLSGSGVVDDVTAGGLPVVTVASSETNTFAGTIQNSSGILSLTTSGNGILILSGSNSYTGGTFISGGILQVGAGGTSGTLGTGPVLDSTMLVFNRSDTVSVASEILGSGGLQQNGSGTLNLSGSLAYTGPTAVNAGALSLLADTVTFDASTGAALTIASNVVAQSISENLNLNVNSSNVAVDVTGQGTLQLSSTLNHVLGFSDVNFGPNNSGTADLGCRLAANLNLGSVHRTIYGWSGGNDVARNNLTGCDCQFAGSISGSAELTLVGQNSFAGVNTMEVPFAFNAANSFTGPLEISRGSVYLGNANALTMGNVLILDPPASVNSRLFLYGFNASVSDLQTAGYGSVVIADGNNVTTTNVGPATLTITQNNPFTFGGVLCDWFTEYISPITGSKTPVLSLVKNGPAALVLTGANTYSGTTIVNAGKLYINNRSTGGGVVTVNGTATLGGSGIINSLVTVKNGGSIEAGAGNGIGNLSLNGLTLGSGNGDLSVLNLSAGAQLNVGNTNGLTVQSSAGSVTVNVGAGVSSLGVYPLITYKGALGGTGFAAFQLGSLPLGILGNLSNDVANASVDFVVTQVTFPRWSGAVSAEWSTNTLAAPKNWVLDSDGVTPLDYIDGEAVSFDDSAVHPAVNISIANVSPASVTFSNTVESYTVTGSFGITGLTGLTKLGGGILTVGNINNYAGNTVIATGTLSLGVVGAIPNGAGAGNVTVNGTLDVGGFNTAINGLSGNGVVDNVSAVGTPVLTVNCFINSSFSGVIQNSSGVLGLTLAGGGSLTLNGNNTYSGPTMINNGTLVVNGLLGTGGVTVQGGSGLGGTGNLNGSCLLANNSALNLTPNTPLTAGSLTLNGLVTVNVSGNVSLTNAATYLLMNHGVESGTGNFQLAALPGLLNSGFAANLIDTNNQLQLVITPAKVTGSIADVKHVIIWMMENRSFDHYFGTLHGVHGFSDRNPLKFQNGKSVFNQANGSSYVLPFHTSDQCINDLAHDWTTTHQAVDSGWNDQWNPAKGTETMAYMNRSDLPYYYALADAYTVCDEYHCSTLTSTDPNRLYLMTGMIDPTDIGGGPVTDNTKPANGWGTSWVTYPELLQKAGVSWQLYQQADGNEDNALSWMASFMNAKPGSVLYQKGLATVPSLATALQNAVTSNTLPSVSWVVPGTAISEHPPYSPATGEALTKSLLDAIASNPAVYNSTVFILMYDENDGFFDHEVPIFPPVGTANEFVGGLPIGLGVRVPMIVVSPWSRGGYVSSQVFDSTSVLRFLEDWTGVKCPYISAWRRQVCGDLTNCLDFSHPNTNYPSLAGVSAISCSSGLTPAVPSPQAMPVQEAGTLIARPLPYQPNTTSFCNPVAGNFNLVLTNSGSASVHFAVYPNAWRSDGPWPYDVLPGSTTNATFNVLTNRGNYDFTAYGPNGFVRRFAGNINTNGNATEVNVYLNPLAQNIELALANGTLSPVTYYVTNNYPTNGTAITVPAYSTNAVQFLANTNNGWYDVTVTGGSGGSFLRQFAGHIETNGEPGSFVSSKNASNYRDIITFTVTLSGYGTPTGTVQFRTNGVALGVPVTLNGGAASISTASLFCGTTLISAEYSGDLLNPPVTNTLNQVVINEPPTVTLNGTSLLTNEVNAVFVDPGATAVGNCSTIVGFTTNNPVKVNIPGIYQINYVATDAAGNSTTNSRTVVVSGNFSNLGTNSISSLSNYTVLISVYGIPNYQYLLEAATNLNGFWWPVATNVADSYGFLIFYDQNATNPQRFYRTTQPAAP